MFSFQEQEEPKEVQNKSALVKREWPDSISPQEQDFLFRYATTDDIVLAARLAEYPITKVSWIGKKIMARPECKVELIRLKDELGKPTEILEEDLVREFKIIAEANIQDYLDEFGEVKPIDTIDPLKAKAIKSFKKTINPKTGVITLELTMHDKITALAHLGKNIGFYAADNGQQQGDINIQINVPGALANL